MQIWGKIRTSKIHAPAKFCFFCMWWKIVRDHLEHNCLRCGVVWMPIWLCCCCWSKSLVVPLDRHHLPHTSRLCFLCVSIFDGHLPQWQVATSYYVCKLGCCRDRWVHELGKDRVSSTPAFVLLHCPIDLRYGASLGGSLCNTSKMYVWWVQLTSHESETAQKAQTAWQTPSPWWWSCSPLQRRGFDEPMPPERWLALRMFVPMPLSKRFNRFNKLM